MAPHLRPHYSCSPPLMASEHLGFYLVTGKNERTPLCEIHSYGAAGDKQSWHEVFYTGPKQKSITAIKHHRSPGEIAAYEDHHEVALENDISMGGRALFMHSRERNSYDVWLFGPLSFLDVAYGSLIFELSGYAPRHVFQKVDQVSRKLVVWTKFMNASPGYFQRCKILQVGFHPKAGAAINPSNGVDDLKSARRGASLAILKKPFIRVDWTVLSAIAAQTDCALYEQEGLR